MWPDQSGEGQRARETRICNLTCKLFTSFFTNVLTKRVFFFSLSVPDWMRLPSAIFSRRAGKDEEDVEESSSSSSEEEEKEKQKEEGAVSKEAADYYYYYDR